MRQVRGFTIVELLIVIVVIAILAAITIVAYNGIQNRANDNVIQSDLSKFAKTVRLYEAENGALPKGDGNSTSAFTFAAIKFKPSKASYYVGGINLYYCEGLKSGQSTFTIISRSASMTMFMYRPESGITTPTSGNLPSNCSAGWDGSVYTSSYGYSPSTSYLWADWTNG